MVFVGGCFARCEAGCFCAGAAFATRAAGLGFFFEVVFFFVVLAFVVGSSVCSSLGKMSGSSSMPPKDFRTRDIKPDTNSIFKRFEI